MASFFISKDHDVPKQEVSLDKTSSCGYLIHVHTCQVPVSTDCGISVTT
jgi:hypothetical protein